MKFVIFAALLGACVTCAVAQTSPASTPSATASSAPTKDPVAASLRMLLPRSRNNILGAISAMPADKFNFKPTPDQITFVHLVVHIINSNNSGCAHAADVTRKKSCSPRLLHHSISATMPSAKWTILSWATAWNYSADINFLAPWQRSDWPAVGRTTMPQRHSICV
jgi:hypothetical protein